MGKALSANKKHRYQSKNRLLKAEECKMNYDWQLWLLQFAINAFLLLLNKSDRIGCVFFHLTIAHFNRICYVNKPSHCCKVHYFLKH